ncbi:hypothetical protein jhhlp_000230 [Lomentospora prolificans]|uniref:Uncharacterized protein n=1 Tax=Lomentospora prolificans TaxID=41688 RepID=A0A2N3NKD1_9PEZI|nr:hypothetical protein jhhlp_000230 [Lomentospora prolificans]
MMNNVRDPSRLRMGLNPLLTTSIAPSYQQNAPLSAISLSSSVQYPLQTPVSAIQPYNPQEWVASPMVGPERTHSFGHDQQPGSPPPPPPYSPPRSQQPVSQPFEPITANTSAARIPPPNTNTHRPSPDPPATTNFPPPPNAPGRGASRDRRFGLPSLTRRREHDQNAQDSSPRAAGRGLLIQIPSQQEQQRTNATHPHIAPPSARRAASAGGAIETPTSARSRPHSQVRWEPGMPLPPPPPGPPPAQSRSQSLQPTDRSSMPVASPPTRRPPPSGVTALGPVPPTPANWVDEDSTPNHRSEPSHHGQPSPPTVDTSSIHSSNQPEESSASGSSSNGNLSRARAVRHDKTIIQRRAESRTRRNSINPDDPSLAVSDIVVPSSSTLSRRLTINRSTPRSAGRGGYDNGERNITPRALGSSQMSQGDGETSSYSPRASRATPSVDASPAIASQVPETPPPRARSSSSDANLLTGESMLPPPSGASLPPTRHSIVMQSSDQFTRETINRYKLFAMREASAETDAERVRLFADFIVSESRIRRERYSGAIAAMGSEIFDLTRDLFRPMASRRESGMSFGGDFTPQSTAPNSAHKASIQPNYPEGASNSAPPSATLPASPAPGGTPTNANWGTNGYMPSLSPILSMSNVDESDSRGRPASRWWEADSAGGGDHRLERSKRESKYMGVPKEAREALQWVDSPRRVDAYSCNDSGSPNDYPPEKNGFLDQEQVLTPQNLRHSVLTIMSASSQPSTPNPSYLDISRLVTLPPPYPRHHPAVNNNHPDLSEIRSVVRTLSDLDEVKTAKESFQKDSERRRQELKKQTAERRQALRLNLQDEINSGNMSYAEAAAIDADATEAEKDQTKEMEKIDFEQFQKLVVAPINELLTTRIAHSTQLLNELASGLFSDNENAADMPQEEGDDKPELLEKLTLLKWIFEARETLHKAIYDLLSDRNERYKAVIITPYRLSGNEEKLRSAEAFFKEDAAKRAFGFATEVLTRTEEFEKVVAENVSRGVEVQLSAFWDIAPNISGLLDRIPNNLAGFRVQIPADEYDENPSYHEHPLQYLFSLVLHAEKSTYQFIESQTNLLCLLHEVREAVTHAKVKVIEAEVDEDGNPLPSEDREGRARQTKEDAGRRLTDDLKEKVRVVQDQWNESLGEAIRHVKERVGGWLLETGGWDEQLEEDGVGVA